MYAGTLLFQINLSEIPSGTVLPESGIMQFFITDVENINDIRMRVKYYPYTDSFDESDFGKSVKLVFEQREGRVYFLYLCDNQKKYSIYRENMVHLICRHELPAAAGRTGALHSY